jgi:hypothetical protein
LKEPNALIDQLGWKVTSVFSRADEIGEAWDQIKAGADTEAVIVWDEPLKVFTMP